MKKILLSLCALSFFYAAQAQVTVGPKIGVNMYNEMYQFSGQYDDYSTSGNTMKTGFQAGLAMNVQTNDYFAIRPEFLFNQVGGIANFHDNNGNSTKVNNTYNYLSLPINLVGTFQAGPGKINVFVAPQFSLGVGGMYKSDADSAGALFTPSSHHTYSGNLSAAEQPDGNNNGDTHYYNPMNFGLNYGLGYQLGGVLLTAQYHMGISNNQPHFQNDDKENNRSDIMSKNSGFTIGLTYFFGATTED